MSKHSKTEPQAPREGAAERARLVQIKPGYFLNPEQIVSVRVLPQENDNGYALLQLSNGDKLHLTREEFTMLTGEEPRQATRLPQKPGAAS